MQQYYEALERMSLSGEDLARLRVIEWLLSQKDENRRTGRTRLMALAFIRTAAEDGPIDVFDHVAGKPGMDNMRNVVGGLIPAARLRARGSLHTLSVDPVPAAPERPASIWQKLEHKIGSAFGTMSDEDGGAFLSLIDDLKALCRSLSSYGFEEEELVIVVRETVRRHSVRSVMKE